MAVNCCILALVIFSVLPLLPRNCAAYNREVRQLNAKMDQMQTSFQRRIDNLELEVENLKAALLGSGSAVIQDEIGDCGSHTEIANGKVTGDSFLGGMSTISCDPGYSPTGSARCKVPVAWKSNAKCVRDCPYLELAHGVSQPATSVSHGSTITITCDSGYALLGNDTATCDDGVYLYMPSCVEAGIDCPYLELAHGVSQPATSVSHGSTINITCDSGYTLLGNDTAICDDGVYLYIPSCVEAGIIDMAVISFNVIDVGIPADEDRSDITGLVFLPDGRLVVCDNNNNRIKVLDNKFTVTDILEVNFGPYDVANVNATSLVVTLPWKSQLQFVHMGTELRLGNTIAVGNICWGVDVLGDTIYSSCHNSPQWGGEIRIYNVDGIFARRIGLTDEQGGVHMYLMAPYYLTVSRKTGNIYVTDYDTDQITRMSWNGSNIYQYFDPGLSRPRGLFLDVADNIFVCNSDAHSLVVITNTWRKYKSLLTFGDGLYNPFAVGYRPSDATLVISADRNGNQLVVKLSN